MRSADSSFLSVNVLRIRENNKVERLEGTSFFSLLLTFYGSLDFVHSISGMFGLMEQETRAVLLR